jgi:release factor glutamine methyltransferase
MITMMAMTTMTPTMIQMIVLVSTEIRLLRVGFGTRQPRTNELTQCLAKRPEVWNYADADCGRGVVECEGGRARHYDAVMPLPTDTQLVARLRAAGCVFAEEEAALLTEAARARTDPSGSLEHLVARRVAGEPLEQVLGWAEFAGRRILLEPGVFVPRRRTEVLAREAVALARAAARRDHVPVVVDLCCGAGAIGAAIMDAAGTVQLVAADLDPAAVRAARRNLEPLGALVVEGDLFDPLPEWVRGRIDVLAVNAPYVPTAEIAMMPSEARDHEARVALDGGTDGLDVHRRVAASAHDWLGVGGSLLIETSRRQASTTAHLLETAGLCDVRVEHDPEIEGTVVIARRAPAGPPA